jgi:hypothetical protein
MNSTMADKMEVGKAFRIAVPKAEELSNYYQGYLKYINADDDLFDLISKQRDETQEFLSSIDEDRASFAYAPGKWQLKEVVGHFCDSERIMCYRALCIARKDKTPLPGFDENLYTPASNYSKRTLKNISEELRTVREATLSLIGNFDPEMFDFKGIANENEISVRAIIYMIYVHQQHHISVIRERYLS